MLTDLNRHADAIIEAADADIAAHEARKAAAEAPWDGALRRCFVCFAPSLRARPLNAAALLP